MAHDAYTNAIAAAYSEGINLSTPGGAGPTVSGGSGAAVVGSVFSLVGQFAATSGNAKQDAVVGSAFSLGGAIFGTLTGALGALGPIGIIAAVVGGVLAFTAAKEQEKILAKTAKLSMERRNVETLWVEVKNLVDQQDVGRDTTVKQGQQSLLSAEGASHLEAQASDLLIPFAASENIAEATRQFVEAQELAKLDDVIRGTGPSVALAGAAGALQGAQVGIGLNQAIESFQQQEAKQDLQTLFSKQVAKNFALGESADSALAAATLSNLQRGGAQDAASFQRSQALNRLTMQQAELARQAAAVGLKRTNRATHSGAQFFRQFTGALNLFSPFRAFSRALFDSAGRSVR